MRRYILAIDSGSVRTRAVVFDAEGRVKGAVERSLRILHREEGWVEQDAEEIFESACAVSEEAIAAAGITKADIDSLGLTNQRETTIVWRRDTGKPIAPAICLQSRQSLPEMQELKSSGLQEEFQQKTALVFTPYFSLSKICWLLRHVEGAQRMAESGDLMFGTADTWLLYRLSGGKIHATDCSNASWTMLFDLKALRWDHALLAHIGVLRDMMPVVYPSSMYYGTTAAAVFGAEIPITGVVGNQQAGLFGQRCFHAGMAKNSYGEGSFFLVNTGEKLIPSHNGLIATIGWSFDTKPCYALEGSILSAGSALSWLMKTFRIADSLGSLDALAGEGETEGVYFVPALHGLSAPWWREEARGMLLGLSDTTTAADIARAALSALAYIRPAWCARPRYAGGGTWQLPSPEISRTHFV